MKFGIFYFSGTGNTKKVVDEYVNAFQNLGHEIALVNIEEKFHENQIELDGFDKIGFAYPIHAFNAPSIVLKFAKKIKKLEKQKDLFIIKSSGEPLALNNISSLKLRSILRHKKLKLSNEYHYCMPYNIIFRHSDSMAFKMWDKAKQVIPIDAKEIVDGKISKLRYFPFGRCLAFLFRIEHWGGRFNGKRYRVNENCIHCGMCATRCPVNNITIEDGAFKFGKNCLMCMRCSFFCPKNAIKIGFFDQWKVNGAYSFKPSDDEEKHQKYCQKAYIKYFARIENKIKNVN